MKKNPLENYCTLNYVYSKSQTSQFQKEMT